MKGVKLSESGQDVKPKCSWLIRYWLGQDDSGPTEDGQSSAVSLRWPTATVQLSLKPWITRQTFVAQQPQVTNWQFSPMPPPSTYQQVFPTSARIEEVPSPSSGRTSRSGSHPTLQRNDSNSSYRNQQFHQSEVPRSTNVPYERFYNYSNVPFQSAAFTSHNVGTHQNPLPAMN